MARWTSRNVTVEACDGAGNRMEWSPGPGDLTVSNLAEGNLEVVEALDRGDHDGLFYTTKLTNDVSLTIEMRNQTLTDAVGDRVLDWVNKTGKVAGYTSVDACVWAFILKVTFTDGAHITVVTLPKFRPTASLTEALEGNSIPISGINYLPPVIT